MAMTLGQRVRKARLEKGYSQKQLGEIIKTARYTTVGELECGHRFETAIKTIGDIARVLDISPNELFGWNEPQVFKVKVKLHRKARRCTCRR